MTKEKANNQFIRTAKPFFKNRPDIVAGNIFRIVEIRDGDYLISNELGNNYLISSRHFNPRYFKELPPEAFGL